MRPAEAGGIENLSRSFLDQLIRLDHFNHYTVLVPAEVQYDFDARSGANVKFVAGDAPRVAMREVACVAPVTAPPAGLQYWRTTDVETLRRARAMDVEVALSIPGYIHPDLMPLTNVLVMPDIQHEYCPEFFPGRELDERRRLYTNSAHRAVHICAISEFTRETLIERLGMAPERVTTTHLAADPIFEPGSPARGDHRRVLDRYGLPFGEYLFFPGHTWPHKNHQGAVEALRGLGKVTASTLCWCARGVPARRS